MSNAVTAWVRTHVPLGIASAISIIAPWLADHQLGWIHLDSAQAGSTAVAVVFSIYYTIVHWIEQHYPQIGILLGKAKQPFYKQLDAPK